MLKPSRCYVLFLLLFLSSGSALAQLCNGLVATHLGSDLDETIIGTDNDDVIVSLGGIDHIFSGAGNDTICSGDGEDIIDGGAGNDWIDGGADNDQIKGGPDNDTIFGGDGDDTIRGSKGDDTIDGGSGEDHIDGGWGDDTVKGGPDNDTIFGNLGMDTLRGSKGDDTIDGGAGNDNLNGGRGNDIIKGGPDNDWLDGGWGDDTLRGSRGDDTLDGGPGNDALHGGVQVSQDTCVLENTDTEIPLMCEKMLGCEYEVSGTTTNSGTPEVIDTDTGTVIFANFFNGGAISNGADRSVSVCVSEVDSAGRRFAHFSTNVGQDDNTSIKAYPEFIIGTKFGLVGETSFRPYPVLVSSTGFEYPDLEMINDVVGLPAFTSNLPDIDVLLDIDEQNVVGAIRDVMLESWFYDTAMNSVDIGDNVEDNSALAGSLNNIVGIGHPNGGSENSVGLRNVLLEMMVHIGPLDVNDVSGAVRFPASFKLPVLPVVIGDYSYSIWYGETFLSPLVVFSRESNLSGAEETNLSEEGEVQLDWNEFLEFSLNELEGLMQAHGVPWASGVDNPFPGMRSVTGAIGGIEFGIEPQTNSPSDAPYAATVRKFEVWIGGTNFGL